MIVEESRRARFRELSYLLDDDDDPLSLEIHNVPEAWSVHVYGTKEDVPVVKTGQDLSILIEEAVETFRKRRIVAEMSTSSAKTKKT